MAEEGEDGAGDALDIDKDEKISLLDQSLQSWSIFNTNLSSSELMKRVKPSS